MSRPFAAEMFDNDVFDVDLSRTRPTKDYTRKGYQLARPGGVNPSKP